MLTRKSVSGFSLVEIAIVLAIVAVLMAGLLPTISGQVEQHRISETRKQLDEIRQALTGYAIINGRLPCPADGTIATGQSNAGEENTSGTGSAMTCVNTGGVLPWATLGVSETDAWGRRFTYRVDTDFADGTDGTSGASCAATTGVSFQLCSEGNLYVWSDAAHASKLADKVPAVVVSHGKNGYGAYTPTGQLIAGAANDEAENADDNNNFVSHDFTPSFDDQVIWISPNILLNRMVTAGKLP